MNRPWLVVKIPRIADNPNVVKSHDTFNHIQVADLLDGVFGKKKLCDFFF
jgi:hypothetical protein